MTEAFVAPPPRPVPPGLHLVATPIGNLRDITLRALDVLASADLVLAEDTRVTARLLAAYGLKRPLERCDDHTAAQKMESVSARLESGQVVALVSDAGTPLISDPGFKLVRHLVERGHPVFAVPGPSSVLAALCVAGLPTDRFVFAGFAPAREGARRRFYESLAAERGTLVLFETGPRLVDSLREAHSVLGDRPAAAARELTKLYETCARGPLSALVADPRLAAPKGEIVLVIAGAPDLAAEPEEVDRALEDALVRAGPAEAAAEVARALGLDRKTLYRRALDLKGRA